MHCTLIANVIYVSLKGGVLRRISHRQSFQEQAVYDLNVVAYLQLLKVAHTGCGPRGLVLSRDKSLKLGSETVMDLVFREVRELGLGMIYIDQHPSLVSYPALGNTSTHIYMNLGLDTKQSSDVLDASNMLGLNYDEQGYYLRRLPIGTGFMLCRGAEFPEPFLVSFPKFDMEKGTVSDREISEFMKGKVPREEPRKGKPGKAEPDLREDEELQGEISEDGWKIMKMLGSGRGAFASQIYKDLRMSGNAFKNKAEMLQDIGVVDMKAGKIRKNRLNYYFLTELGQKVFETRFGSNVFRSSVKDREIVETFRLGGWKASLKISARLGRTWPAFRSDETSLLMIGGVGSSATAAATTRGFGWRRGPRRTANGWIFDGFSEKSRFQRPKHPFKMSSWLRAYLSQP